MTCENPNTNTSAVTHTHAQANVGMTLTAFDTEAQRKAKLACMRVQHQPILIEIKL